MKSDPEGMTVAELGRRRAAFVEFIMLMRRYRLFLPGWEILTVESMFYQE